jgi:hypothetical protein
MQIRLRWVGGLGFLAVLLLLAMPAAHAQRYLGGLSGRVTDTTGAAIPGATVVAEEGATHFKTTVKTAADGGYNIAGIQPGTYSVSVSAKSFAGQKEVDIIVTAGQTEQINFKMKPGAAVQTVRVSAQSPLMDTSSPNIATTFSTQETKDLPNNGRDPFNLSTLAPGVVDRASGGYFQGKSSQFTNPFSGVAVQITTNGNGGHNRLTLDGIPDDAAERFSGATYNGFVPSPEAVQEVKVQYAIADAEVGHGNGTVTNTVIRSGTNQLHGALYYVFQNTYLNANDYEKVPNQDNPNPKLRTPRNNDQVQQTGAVVAGPVIIPKVYDGRNKTFFMVAFERYHTHQGINYSTRVPTAAELKGDFSGLCTTFDANGLCTDGIQLYNPQSPVDVNGNRTEYFPYNNIAPYLNSAGEAFASFLPAANVPNSTGLTNPNYISSQTSYPSSYPSFIIRIDQAIGARNKLNGIFFRSGLTQNYPFEGFDKGIPPGGHGYNVYRNNRGGSIDDVQQFSDTMVLDSRFGVIYHPFGLTYPGSSNYDLSSVHISGSGLPYQTFPGENMADGYASLASGAGGQISTDVIGSLSEILTKTWGPHTVRIGYQGEVNRYNVENPQSGFAPFYFDRRFTQQNVNAPVGSQANSGDAFADMLLGDFSNAGYNINIAYAMQQLYSAIFAQDDWRVTNKLTLNLGLRWGYESPMTERYNRMIKNFCTTCTNPLQASVSGLPLYGGLQFAGPGDRLEYPRDLSGFQPRIGFAYQLDRNTVVRGGFGMIDFNTLETPFSTGYSQSTSYLNTTDGITPINSMSNPFPTGVTLPTGNSLGLATGIGQGINFIDQNHRQPRSAQYTVSIQRQLPWRLAAQVAYVGNHAYDLEVGHNINFLPARYYNQGTAGVDYLNAKVPNPMAGLIPNNAGLNGSTIQQYLLLLPYPEFGGVYEQDSSIGSTSFNALEVQVSKPMGNHFSLQGNFTWDKVMERTGYRNSFDTQLSRNQNSDPDLTANIWGTYMFPTFNRRPVWERLAIGGWQLNGIMRMEDGPLVSAPGGVDIIGNVSQPNPTDARYINTCYENAQGVKVMSTPSAPACDSLSPNPAYRQRLAYTSQVNGPFLGVRQRVHPLVDASLFKKFEIHKGVNFEIRGEFFNVLNTPNFGSPGTGLGSSTFGEVVKVQNNDPRIGQLTARINF